MSSAKNNIQDKKDLEKFIKFLALKSTQVIVQSRLGEKIQTQCNPHTSGNDWDPPQSNERRVYGNTNQFNIAIQDQPDVLAETKKVLFSTGSTSGIPNESIIQKLPLCVEISLQTIEGDKMVLEVWSLNIQLDQSDPSLRATYTVYNRMGILLKSLISVTRITPAYKLSRRQSSDSYNIYYRIYCGDPQLHNLGEGCKQVRVGQLCTTVGTLHMAVAYRTKMTISPTQTSGRDTTIMLKSDHFLKDLSPKHVRYHHIKKCEKKVIDLDKPLQPGAFFDPSKIRQYTEEDYILPEHPPFSWLLNRKTKEETGNETCTDDDRAPTQLLASTPEECATVTNNNNAEQRSFEMSEQKQNQKPAAAGQPNSAQTRDAILGASPSKNSAKINLGEVTELSKKPAQYTKQPPEDEKLLKELHFPFATLNSPMADLAKFYRECFHAPPLQGLREDALNDEDETVDDVTKQLEQFETSMGDYDSLVTSICCQVDDNSNS